MGNSANRTPRRLEQLAQATGLCFGVFMLAACGGWRSDEGTAKTSYPPPVVAPSTSESGPMFVTLAAIDGVTEAEGQKRVTPGGDIEVDTTVTVDGKASDISTLAKGDVALIRGTRYLTYGYCEDPWCDYSYRVDSVDAYHLIVGFAESVDPAHARLVVMGQLVTVSGNSVVNDGVNESAVSQGALSAIQPGWMVAVSGFLSATGDVVATRIARIESSDELLLRGLVTATNAGARRLRIGGLDVDYAQATVDWQASPNGDAAVGDQVVVLADTKPVAGLLSARSMSFVPRSLPARKDASVTLTGLVTRYGSSEDFDVAGVTVRLDCLGDDCAAALQDLAANTAVELNGSQAADGQVNAWHLSTFLGGLQADEQQVRHDDGETTLVAPIAVIDSVSGSLNISGFHVQSSPHTRVVDRRDGHTSTLSVEDLKVGDLVSAAGTHGGMPELLIAESIARVPLQDPQITTYRFAREEPAITVLGRSILTTDSTLWDRCGSAADSSSLFGGDLYVHYLKIGLRAPLADPLEASWVSAYGDGCQ